MNPPRTAPWASCLLALLALSPTPPAQADPLEMSGFSWAENLTFDGRGALMVSDSTTGEIWRIDPDGEGSYRRSLVATGFKAALGLAYLRPGGTLYAAVRTFDDAAPNQIVAISPSSGAVTTIVEVPEIPNGLEADPETGLLYVTTEAGFVPGESVVYEVDPLTFSYRIVMSGLFSADGAAIDLDRRLLYVGEVVTGKVHIYDLDRGEVIDTFQAMKGQRLQFLDDFEVEPGGAALIGADFARGTVVRLPIGEDLRGRPEVIASGFKAPTSVAIGEPPVWAEDSVFVSEGGGFVSAVTNRRVVEITGALVIDAAHGEAP